ncbi:MAG TPA: YihY/virulence factor BrkB family protein [Armatimonadota bacterium]|nr:YihY/virulence factor BrkB family protein [Armatimonadota bacterium]
MAHDDHDESPHGKADLMRRYLLALPGAGRVAWETYQAFTAHKSAALAGAVAFYTLLGLSPLLFVVGAVVRLVYGDGYPVLDRALPALQPVIPLQRRELAELLGNFVSASSVPIGSVGFIGLLWTASSAFNLTYEAICHAGGVPARFIRRRLMGLAAPLVLGMVALAMFFAASAAPLARLLFHPPIDLGFLGRLALFGRHLVNGLGVAPVLFVVYKACAGRHLGSRHAVVSALIFGPVWEFSKWGFWHIAADTAQRGAVYGALTTVVMVLLWVYYSAAILILGAEMAFVLQRRGQGPGNERTTGPV